jgi:hypothetical protein
MVCLFVVFLSLQLAEEKLYEHWKQNAPELRQVSMIDVVEGSTLQ